MNARFEQFYDEGFALSGSARDRLASLSGPPDAEVGLLLHCQTKDGLARAF